MSSSQGFTAADAASIAGDALLSIPRDLWNGAGHLLGYLNPFDDRSAGELLDEDLRVGELLLDLLKRAPELMDLAMRSVVEIYFEERLPGELRTAIQAHAETMGLSVGTRTLVRTLGSNALSRISSRLAVRALAGPVAASVLAKVGLSAAAVGSGVGAALGVVSLAGTVELAQQGSARLRASHPLLYAALAPNNLDLLWFLVADSIDALELDFQNQIREMLGQEPRAAPEERPQPVEDDPVWSQPMP